jgi:hypothetical protein
MGKAPLDHYRIKYAVLAIKKELVYQGYSGIRVDTPVFGSGLNKAVRAFQGDKGLVVDGLVGQKTCNALWRKRILANQNSLHISGDWLRAQLHWESGDDPGAEYTNPDGSRDRGLVQLNSSKKPATDDEAFDPSYSIPFLGNFQKDGAAKYKNCTFQMAYPFPDEWKLAVGRWRTPVGADEWCHLPDTQPNKDGTWAQKAAYYVSRVDTDGRHGWV